VPYFIFDRKYALSGAQPIETFEAALHQSFSEWKEAQPKNAFQSLNQNNNASCNDNGCAS